MYFTVPETYEPTGTVVKGLIVPVACTTDVMAPCSTRAVRNLGGSGLRLSVQAAAMATPAAAAAASHPTFNRLLLSCSSCTIGPEGSTSHPIPLEPVAALDDAIGGAAADSFGPQSRHGIDSRGAACRPVTGGQRHRGEQQGAG